MNLFGVSCHPAISGEVKAVKGPKGPAPVLTEAYEVGKVTSPTQQKSGVLVGF